MRIAADTAAATAEVVVVDDASTDATVAAAQQADADVVVPLDVNGGPSAARNAGVARSRGDVLVFLDADDVLLPYALATFRSGLSAGVDLVRTGAVRGPRNSGTTHISLARPRRQPFPGGTPAAGSSAIRRVAFDRVGGYDPSLRFGENSELLLRVAVADASAPHSSQPTGGVCFRLVPTVRYFTEPGRNSGHHGANRMSAIEHVLGTHADVLAADPDTLSNHFAIAADLARRNGAAADAMRWAGRAVRVRPRRGRNWLRLARAACYRSVAWAKLSK